MSDESSNSQNASNKPNQTSDSARRDEAEVKPPASNTSPMEPVSDQTAPEATSKVKGTTPTTGGAIAEEHPVHTEEMAEAEVSATKEEEQAAQREADESVYAASRRSTRRSFLVGGAAAAAGIGFFHWITHSKQEEMQPELLRHAFEFNAAISREIYDLPFLAPTYPLKRAESLRVNGVFGLEMRLDLASWRLQVVGVRNAAENPLYTKDVTAWEYRYINPGSTEDRGHPTKINRKMMTSTKMAPMSMQKQAQEDELHTGRKPRGLDQAGESLSTLPIGTPGLLLTIEDLKRFPRCEMVTQFKCIEGWGQIVEWAGIRLRDFMEEYPPERLSGREPRYVYMETPDGNYYTGYDIKACRHPQALLVTHMMGEPLTEFHGAPLRLSMPTKYGYKQIKRIGLISYTDQKPDDYWAKLGYDWYGGI